LAVTEISRVCDASHCAASFPHATLDSRVLALLPEHGATVRITLRPELRPEGAHDCKFPAARTMA